MSYSGYRNTLAYFASSCLTKEKTFHNAERRQETRSDKYSNDKYNNNNTSGGGSSSNNNNNNNIVVATADGKEQISEIEQNLRARLAKRDGLMRSDLFENQF